MSNAAVTREVLSSFLNISVEAGDVDSEKQSRTTLGKPFLTRGALLEKGTGHSYCLTILDIKHKELRINQGSWPKILSNSSCCSVVISRRISLCLNHSSVVSHGLVVSSC